MIIAKVCCSDIDVELNFDLDNSTFFLRMFKEEGLGGLHLQLYEGLIKLDFIGDCPFTALEINTPFLLDVKKSLEKELENNILYVRAIGWIATVVKYHIHKENGTDNGYPKFEGSFVSTTGFADVMNYVKYVPKHDLSERVQTKEDVLAIMDELTFDIECGQSLANTAKKFSMPDITHMVKLVFGDNPRRETLSRLSMFISLACWFIRTSFPSDMAQAS